MNADTPPRVDQRTRLLRLAALAFVILLSVGLFLFRDHFRNMGVYGYPGIFLISLISSATVLIPLPGVVLTSALAVVLNPFWVAVAAGAGAAVGEISGYLAGISGRSVVERSSINERLVGWMRRYGDITILVLAFIPNPLFDAAGITAGALKLPFYRFFIWTLVGKILKMMLFAYGGATVLKWIPFEW